jgi:uncharacterized protein (TIGR02302 family)
VFGTQVGMSAERTARAFWPLWSVVALCIGALMLGLNDMLAVEVVWGASVIAVAATIWTLIWGLRRFKMPLRAEAIARIDARLPGRPIAALADTQAIGATDPASQAVWDTHIELMTDRTRDARVQPADLRVSDRDPYGLRYIALLFLAVGLIFGSILRVGTVTEIASGGTVSAAATGPVWEGWFEPPAYTGKPTLYLSDIPAGRLRVPQGSRVTLRLYGDVGALTVAETVSARTADIDSAAAALQSFEITQNGTLSINGEGGTEWSVIVEPDTPPSIAISAQVEADAMGEMSQSFIANDDYGVVAGTATVTLDLDLVDRSYGLAVDPEPRAALILDLPMPFNGDRQRFEETLIEDLSEHPFANLPVSILFEVEDALGQTGQSSDIKIVLPGRRFFQPMARAVIEQRRDILWSRENARSVVQILRAVSHRPEDIFTSEVPYLRLKAIVRRMDGVLDATGTISDSLQSEAAEALWELAIQLEDGSLADARERLERAQDRLSEAMRNGASDEEIAELMQELRDATEDYMRQLAQQNPQNVDGTDQPQTGENSRTITQDELQAMMDRIQELMEEGRMAEAQELMEELNEMMENLQVTENQNGEGGQSEGEQAMEGLSDTLREQQGLSDQAFRDLQEQFNPNAQAGESQQNEGRNGGQGQGEQHSGEGGQGEQGQEGEGQEGQQQGQGSQDGQGSEGQQGGPKAEQSLAQRQQALRDELSRQRNNLPGAGSKEGDAARDALDRAGEAMDGAEQALRNNDLAEAIDQQSEAMDALREGMQSLGEAMAQNDQQQDQQQGQGQEQGDFTASQSQQNRDPLGRQAGNEGQIGSAEDLLQGDDVYRRAGELLDEIRRRSSEQDRPEVERDYLRRLLDRF